MVMPGKLYFTVVTFLLILSQTTSGQDVKICPAEPVLPPGEACPEVCNRGCRDGVCQVHNPWQPLVVLPDSMPSLVTCEGLVWMNGSAFNCWNIVKCSEKATCDFMLTAGAGLYLGVDCGNTTHSCNVFCSYDVPEISDIRCNDTSSCNCRTNCVLHNSKCTRGLNCVGDSCYRNIISECQPGVTDGILDPVPSDGSPCNCTCKDPALTKFKVGYVYKCLNTAGICSIDSDCSYPKGRCDYDCKCINPWGGPKCTTHMCPQCQNNAFCSNDTANPCVCTGLWTGVNCTIPLQVTPSRPEIPENVARCNVTDVVPWVAAPATIAAPPSCPTVCSSCSVDSDGTPVCLILLPRPGVFVFNITCPSTHRCIGHCHVYCPGFFTCTGEYPCDVVCSTPSCGLYAYCSSSSSCQAHCNSLFVPNPRASKSTARFECRRANGSCVCDTEDCPSITPCVPGISCNGDPCVTLDCGGKMVKYNNVTNQCYCQCYPQYYETVEGKCVILGFTQDCVSECKNGGICKEAKCWCPPGYSGADCSVRDACVALGSSSTCPSACDWCSAGVCFFSLRSPTMAPMAATCPVGYPCVFICEAGFGNCNPIGNQVVCPAGSGPCELWCWDYIDEFVWYLADSGEFRPTSPCTSISLICEDGSIGCRSHCTAGDRPDTIYYGGRTVQAIHCGSTNVTSRSPDQLDRCSSCGSDSCYIAESDPCYQQAGFSLAYRTFGFLLPCPTDRLGTWLIPSVNSSNQCECICPNDKSMVNGTCVALGCNPPCQNGGICEIAIDQPGMANDTYRCRCFGGWNGADCKSRCFFPVSANVTACENGRYLISGELKFPENRNVSLYKDVPDLERLEVEGDLSFGGPNSTLSIAPPSNWTGTGTPSVVVSGNWTQANGSTLENAIVFDKTKGTILTTVVNANGTVTLRGSLQLVVSTPDIIEWIKSNGAENVTINLFSYGTLGSTFDTISINDIGSGLSPGCEKIVASPKYSASGINTNGRMDMLFSLDKSSCEANTVPPSPDSPPSAAVSEVAAVNTVGIAIGVSAGVLVAGAIVGGFFWKRYREKMAYAAITKKMTLSTANNAIVLQPMNSVATKEPEIVEPATQEPAQLKWVRVAPKR